MFFDYLEERAKLRESSDDEELIALTDFVVEES